MRARTDPGMLILKSMEQCRNADKIIRKKLAGSKREKELGVEVFFNDFGTGRQYEYEVVVRNRRSSQTIAKFRTPILSETYSGEIEASLLLLFNS